MVGQFRSQELAIETCVNSQTFGDGKNHLSVRNGKTNICGDVDACHKRAFLVAGWVGASLLAGEGDEHFMFTVRATNSSKTFMQIAALEIGCHRLFNDRSPVAILGLVLLVVNLLKRVKMLVDQTPQVGGLRIAGAIKNRRFGTRRSHEKNALSSPMVANRTAPRP